MAECSHDCKSCGAECGDRKQPHDFSVKLNAHSRVGKVVAVASGKGGVGKSLVACLLAAACARKGLKTAVLDADITGPSIPRAFGISGGALQDEKGIIPSRSNLGVEVMSLNLLVKDPSDPVVWRGPVIAGAVQQFWTDVNWGDVDVMIVDMPPGTGDVPLTVFQSLPVDGVVVVSTPQALVEMIVEKSVKMAGMLDRRVLGVVENMSYFTCPKCGERLEVFGESRVEELAAKYGVETVCRLPAEREWAKAADSGAIEAIDCPQLQPLVDAIAG
jgi:Mrp family chromosome partitioning ATPase